MGLLAARRLHRSRSGRVPYSIVAIVILASVLALSLDLSAVESFQNTYIAYDTPENTQAVLLQVEDEITQAAHFDLMNATAQILASTPFGSPVSAPLNLLNATTNTLFTASLQGLGLVAPGTGFTEGTTTVLVTAWGINVTYAEGSVEDPTTTITSSAVTSPDLPTALPVPNPSYPDALAVTQENVYPMAIGTVTLVATDADAGSQESTTSSFQTTLQSEIGLLQSQSAQFADDSFGAGGGFSRLVTYIAEATAELRALAGYGSGGYPGPHDDSTVDKTGTDAILTTSDIDNATSLAVLLESLRYFRSFDANAVTSFLSSLPPGAYQTLLENYVANGTVDAASLYLLLVTSPGDDYGLGEISSGEDIAQAIYSFTDRFIYDMLMQFWDANVVDPTLTDPVANWNLLINEGQTYADNMVVQWLTDYKNWLGVEVSNLPRVQGDVVLPALTGTAGGCTYYLFPGGDVEISAPAISSLEDLILGTLQEADVTLANGTAYNDWFAPNIYPVYDNLTFLDPYGHHTFCEWSGWNPAHTCYGGLGVEQQGYYVVDRSLIDEYATDCSPWVPRCASAPGGVGGTATYFDMLRELLLNTSASIENKSSTPTDQDQKGYLDYVAFQGMEDGNNYTPVQAGLPDPTTVAGRNQDLNSTYSLLTNGSDALLSGVISTATDKFATQAANNTTVDSWWINGAAHPDLQPAGDVPGPDPGIAWTMTDIARSTAREWFQELYGLYYGSEGTIPAAPWFPITWAAMDNANYNIVSLGVNHDAPAAGREPDFFMMTQNETYIEMFCWMDEHFSDCRDDDEISGENGYGNTAEAADPTYGIGACGGGALDAAYDNAMAQWWDPTTGTWATWQLVAGVVTEAMDGVVNGPNSLGGGIAGGFATVHQELSQSWWNVKNNTGDAYWACGYTAAACPAYDSGNFTNWIFQKIAPPIINDTYDLGEVGGWLQQIISATERWINVGANTSGTIYRPMLDRDMPYSFWYGNETTAAANAALFNESLTDMMMRLEGGSLAWDAPATTVHLVDPQDESSNMGISPFTTTWEIKVHGNLWAELNSSRSVLGSNGQLVPTRLNVTIPLDFIANATIYTPWELGSGWDPNPSPVAGDPTLVVTRGLVGLDAGPLGLDYSDVTAGVLLPGIYISPALNALFLDSSLAAQVTNSNSLLLEQLLAGLPSRIIGGSGGWAENLTTLESDTHADLSTLGTSGTYLATVQGDMATVLTELTAPGHHGTVGGDLTPHDDAYDAYFGQDFQAQVDAQCLEYYSTPITSNSCTTTFPAYAPQLAASLEFAGPEVGSGFAVDDQYVGAPPVVPNDHGFVGSYGNAGAYSLLGGWIEYGTTYELSLAGPSALPTYTTASSSDTSLPVPFSGPAVAAPATLSVSGAGGLPQAAITAFRESVNSYLPAGGNFEDYVTQQLYASGYLYDSLTGTAPPAQAGIDALLYSTLLQLTGTHAENYSIGFQDPTGLFGSTTEEIATLAFLAWYELNYRAIAYDLGSPSLDPTGLSTAEPLLLQDAYRGVSFTEGDPTTPTMVSWSSPNLAFTEADVGGAGLVGNAGGVLDTPTVDLGGWASAQGGWGFSGTLTGA